MRALVKQFWQDESGQALVEYGAVVGLVAIGAVAAVVAFRDEIVAFFERLTTQIGDIG